MGFLQGCFGSLAEFKLVSRVCRIGQEGEIRFAYLSHHIDTWVGREWAEVDLQLPHVAAIINVVNLPSFVPPFCSVFFNVVVRKFFHAGVVIAVDVGSVQDVDDV